MVLNNGTNRNNCMMNIVMKGSMPDQFRWAGMFGVREKRVCRSDDCDPPSKESMLLFSRSLSVGSRVGSYQLVRFA